MTYPSRHHHHLVKDGAHVVMCRCERDGAAGPQWIVNGNGEIDTYLTSRCRDLDCSHHLLDDDYLNDDAEGAIAWP